MNFERFLAILLQDQGIGDIRQRAYVLATVKHECAGTWLPITERYRGDAREYFIRKYGERKDLGNEQPEDGFTYRGRGFVQLTGRANYARLAKLLNVDLVHDPDAALDVMISYRILSEGCRRGLFTGKKLADYVGPDSADYVGARRVINGQDKAKVIAGYAAQYEALLRSIRAAT